MPVKIDNSGDPANFSVTATEVFQGIANFNIHYKERTDAEYSGRDYTVSWADFSQCIATYMAQFPEVPEEKIAVRFVHCYHTATNTLYMRMLLCEMELTTITEYDCSVFQLLDNNYQLWFDVEENNITLCPEHTFQDEIYLNSFEYKATAVAEETEVLAEDGGFRFVRTLTYPWKEEIWRLWADNGAPAPSDTLLHFAAASYTEADGGDASVVWPHGLVMYLEVNGEVLLNDNNYVSLFHYKGADLGTMCPPKCNSYVTPPAGYMLSNR
jgi:hypothetical protein